MITTILGILTSSGFGAITGLIGGFLAKREQRKLLELENEHEEKMANIELAQIEAERAHALLIVEKNIEQAQVEGQIAEDIRDADAFVESMKQQAKPTGSVIGDTLKAAMRPVLTVALLWVTYDIYQQLDELVGTEGLTQEQLAELYIYVIHSIIFLTVTAVAWWFASRGEKAVAAIKGMMK